MMVLNKYGEIVKKEWGRTGKIRANVDVDVLAVMPNHLHGIIIIESDAGAHRNMPLLLII